MRTCALIAIFYFISIINLTAAELDWIQVSQDGKSFVTAKEQTPFVPWGFNYDHDREGQLLEDYWNTDWKTIEQDFAEMKQLGANVVRIHIQFGKFMAAPDQPRAAALKKLGELLKLAEHTGLYLDLTGLGCYHKQDVPGWYDQLSDAERWQAQANFWSAVAKQCANSPAIFCYDLMNEPVVHGGKKKGTDWLGPGFAGKHFVQRITLSPDERPRPEIAAAWIKMLVDAIRKQDQRHLITVGLVPWSLERPGLQSGFVPDKISQHLDFICVHLYPEKGKVKEALETLKGFDVGKPLVIEETFPLKSSPQEFEEFLLKSKKHADGWIGFYWGQTREEYEKGKTIRDAIMAGWLKFFEENGRQFKEQH
ncbi:Cellulase (glycosyl hydrolase family 5) [Gimesia alba]|uniref:Cellulase (Glycosyl hydrolase family 5) n=1 Tax=Gimesia alba TaxID=2527973 RepID=A0A517R9J7_9PLAN|nr:cellulase family glycosylhydrolase [Gimesia alba]QDT40562.1 Cellulase (glycosyl hydrolase family 5) [Gimesia alba]